MTWAVSLLENGGLVCVSVRCHTDEVCETTCKAQGFAGGGVCMGRSFETHRCCCL